MTTFFVRLPDVRFERTFELGDVTFTPSADFWAQLTPVLKPADAEDGHNPWRSLTRDVADSWGTDTVIAIQTEASADAQRKASDAMAILRFYMRALVRVNLEIHLVGLVGEVRSGVREFIALTDGAMPRAAPGMSRIGGTIDYTFTHADIDALETRAALAFLGEQFRTPVSSNATSDSANTDSATTHENTAASVDENKAADAPGPDRGIDPGARALTALSMYDLGLRAVDPTLRVLSAAIAVETLFAAPQDLDTWRPQTTGIARRVALLSCGGGCGRVSEHCFYSRPGGTLRQIRHNILTTAEAGHQWRCSSFLHIAAPREVQHALMYPPLFEVRNRIAHHGRQDLDARTVTHLIATADQALSDGIDWLAAHPGRHLHELDDEIPAPSVP